MKNKVVLITGAFSGIGLATGKLLAKQGYKVYGTSRKVDENKIKELEGVGINLLQLEVSSEESCRQCVEEVIEKEGKIDILVNNAGFGFYGPIETVEIEEAKKQMEVNVFGIARMTKLVLPYMRKQHSGRIINVSSVAGRVTTFLGGWYHASKYAVEALSNALRMEVKQFGIDVVLIEPGAIMSNWGIIAADNLENSVKDSVYQKDGEIVAKAYRGMYNPDNHALSKPELVARKIYKAIKKKRPRTRYAFGFGAKALIIGNAILPTRTFDWVMKNMYKVKTFK